MAFQVIVRGLRRTVSAQGDDAEGHSGIIECGTPRGDHLRKDRPKFHMALALQVRVRGMLQLLGMMRKQPLPCSDDCVGEGHVPHLDGKTSLMEDLYKHPDTATPIHRQWGGVIWRVRP